MQLTDKELLEIQRHDGHIQSNLRFRARYKQTVTTTQYHTAIKTEF